MECRPKGSTTGKPTPGPRGLPLRAGAERLGQCPLPAEAGLCGRADRRAQGEGGGSSVGGGRPAGRNTRLPHDH